MLRLITLSRETFLSVTVLIEYPTITAHSKYAPPPDSRLVLME